MSKVADVFRRPSVLIETPENGIETLASYMNVSIFVIVIVSFLSYFEKIAHMSVV